MKAGEMLAFNTVTQRYLDLLDALQQAAIATTAEGVIVDWNRSAEKLYGWRRDDALGRNVLDVTPAVVSRDDAAAIMKSLGDGTIWSGQFPVRTRSGETFTASVTDVPIVDDFEKIVGVVGVSAPSRTPASLASSLIRFGAACGALWPGRVDIGSRNAQALLAASEPHILQLLSLLIIRYSDALDRGASVEVTAAGAEESVFADFGIRAQRAVYLRFAERADPPAYSVLRDEVTAAHATNYAATLVRLVGGWLFVERAGNGTQIMHLLLPVAD